MRAIELGHERPFRARSVVRAQSVPGAGGVTCQATTPASTAWRGAAVAPPGQARTTLRARRTAPGRATPSTTRTPYGASRQYNVAPRRPHFPLPRGARGATPLRVASFSPSGRTAREHGFGGKSAAPSEARTDGWGQQGDDQDRLQVCNGVAYTYDENGSLTSRDADTFEYDIRGSLLSATVSGTTVDYRIDGAGRRVARTSNGQTTRYVYSSQLRIAAQLDGSGNVTSRFYYADGINVPELMVRGGVTYRIVTDHLGSPREVVDVATGQVVFAATYGAWGERTVTVGDPSFVPFGFAGGLHDVDTGWVRFGFRDYDPSVGRWTAKDPVRWVGQQANLFVYLKNDPVTGVDVTGLWFDVQNDVQQEALLALYDVPVLVPFLDEMANSSERIQFLPVSYNRNDPSHWDPVQNELQYNVDAIRDSFADNNWAGGLPAAFAHELGHAYVDVILGQDSDRELSNDWSLEFQNAVASEESGSTGCRDTH